MVMSHPHTYEDGGTKHSKVNQTLNELFSCYAVNIQPKTKASEQVLLLELALFCYHIIGNVLFLPR